MPCPRVTRLAARSTTKSSVLTIGSSPAGVRPPQRGPQPGQQLVHAEGLRDVVVGADVECGSTFEASSSRADSTRIGTVVQPRSPWTTSMPSMPGRPRSSTTASGCRRAASSNACSPDVASSTS